ncbi:MAG TPA: hypothetical protein VI837_07515 [Blastocatellia bacterium]|nr:hypothetical protein [Blastocatellia bacterium]
MSTIHGRREFLSRGDRVIESATLGLPPVTHSQLYSLLGSAAIELYFHFATGLDCADAAGEFVRRPNRLLIKLGDNVAQLQSAEISRAVVDYPMNL